MRQETGTSANIALGPTHQPGLELRDLAKTYGQVVAVRGVDLLVHRGEFVTILGPSGSGKTTILRLVAGFMTPTSGHILLNGEDVSHRPPAERGVGMVFQNYALFPHMTVGDNIKYGLKMRHWPKPDANARVSELLDLVRLAGLEKRLPRELSGGQQQRVALARALAFEPSLLLMDEPLGALDRELRMQMASELRRIHRQLGTTSLYVTHDREEALTLSDRIAIMRMGVIHAVDTAPELYRRPNSRFVATFFAGANVVPVRRLAGDSNSVVVECLGQQLTVPLVQNRSVSQRADRLCLVVPPRSLSLIPHTPRDLRVDGQSAECLYLGDALQVTCRVLGVGSFVAKLPVGLGEQPNVPVNPIFYADADALQAVPDDEPDSAGSMNHDGI